MAKKTLRMIGLEVRESDGLRLVIFKAKDSIGRDVEMSIPAEGWDLVYADGADKILAAANSNPETQGGWSRSFHREGEPCRVGTTDDGKVVLTLREGKPTESRQWFDRSTALALAASLREAAEGLPADPRKH